MKLIRRPWIWLSRFRQRRGYGVHSPFAFAFITGVVGERASYYAYAPLSHLHPWWVRWGKLYPMTCRRLLFRLANYAHPQTITTIGECPIERAYMKRAVPSAHWTETAKGAALKNVCTIADFVFVTADKLVEAPAIAMHMRSSSMMVLEGIHRNASSLRLWHALQADQHTGITFDLYTYGVAFFDHARHKQHYLVNF